MNIWSISTPIAGIAAAATMTACAATESAAFRQMTAPDHELAARSGSDRTGATPAQHLAAAQQLRAAEPRACVDVPDSEREMGPFLHPDRIMAVEEVKDRVFPKAPLRPFGAAVTLRATPGVTAQWIGRVIQCHLAHYAAVGAAAGTEDSPLLVAGVQIAVSSTPVGFKVSITSADLDTARAVIAKARALTTNAS